MCSLGPIKVGTKKHPCQFYRIGGYIFRECTTRRVRVAQTTVANESLSTIVFFQSRALQARSWILGAQFYFSRRNRTMLERFVPRWVLATTSSFDRAHDAFPRELQPLSGGMNILPREREKVS